MTTLLDYTMPFLQKVIGAQSITKTVVGYYDLLDNPDEDDSTVLFERMNQICDTEGIANEGLILLGQIFDRLKAYRQKREPINQAQFETTSEICQQYVNWVFDTFPCFHKEDDGRFYYTPK